MNTPCLQLLLLRLLAAVSNRHNACISHRLFDTESFLSSLSSALGQLPDSRQLQLSAAAALQQEGSITTAARLLLCICGSVAAAADTLQWGASSQATEQQFQQLFIALLQAASHGADDDLVMGNGGADQAWPNWGILAAEDENAQQIIQRLLAASSGDEVSAGNFVWLDLCMFCCCCMSALIRLPLPEHHQGLQTAGFADGAAW